MKVKTKRRFVLATCLCDSFVVEDSSREMNAICMAFGVTCPMAPVVDRFSYHEFYVEPEQETGTEN